MRIGILSDTHLPGLIRHLDELGPEPARFFATVDLILHGGDLTSPMVLDWLEQFAPVICTTGNNDPIPDPRCKEVEVLDLAGWRLGLIHSLKRGFRPVAELQQLFPTPVQVMIAGDTHYEILTYRDGVVLLNSGSPTFPHHKELRLGTVGLLELTPTALHAEIIVLGQTPGRPNPGRAITLDIQDGQVMQHLE
jgi:putative phosphoesterase